MKKLLKSAPKTKRSDTYQKSGEDKILKNNSRGSPFPVSLDEESTNTVVKKANILSLEQQRVLDSSAAIKQVIAAAGSGKTRTVIQLAVQVLNEFQSETHHLNSGEHPEQFFGTKRNPLLLLTFSRKAAREMLERIPEEYQKQIQIHTFHGFCFQLIRQWYPGGEEMQVVDEEEKIRILKPLFYRYRYTVGGIPIGLLLSNPRRFRQEFPRVAFRIHRYWNQYKERNQLLEYSDLIRIVLGGLRKARIAGNWAAGIPGSYQTIIVDEFQDTDPAQVEFLQRMSASEMVVVGDDWQAIYSFRGADVKPFLNFTDHFGGVEKHFLSVNYRSVPDIVNAGNRLIKASPGQIKKQVRAHRREREKSVLSLSLETGQEADVVALMQSCSRDWTILCRSNYRRRIWLEAGLSEDSCITIHRSKGLEFSVVILDVLGGWSGAAEDSDSEEVRIAYVALTRARDLFVALHRKDYGTREGDSYVWNRLFSRQCRKTSYQELQRRVKKVPTGK
ncbi:MAG: ATP-dependent helicase [Leptospiraceae bacterium]